MALNRKFFFCCLAALLPATGGGAAALPIDWSGCGFHQDQPNAGIIDSLRRHVADPDTADRLFRLGIAYLRSGDTALALSCLGSAPMNDPALRSLAWEAIGDVMKTRRPDSAVVCYGKALSAPVPLRYRSKIFEKLGAIVQADTLRLAEPSLTLQYARWLKIRRPPPLDLVCSLIDTLMARREWSEADFVIQHTLTSLSDSAQTVVIAAVGRAAPADSELSTPAFFLLARIGIERKNYGIAERMLDAAKRKADFAVAVGEHRYQRLRCKLLFSNERYEEAAAALIAYLRKFGFESDMALLAARACKMADQIDNAAYWYDRFIDGTPRYPGLVEILWRRAWIDEERGYPAAALRYYSRIIPPIPDPSGPRSRTSAKRSAATRPNTTMRP